MGSRDPFSIKPSCQYCWSVYTVVCISFSIFTLQQQYKLQHTEEKLKELQEIVESRYKNILFEYSQKLQMEREARMKLENETKLMEKQVCGLFMLALKKSNILISYMVCARQLHIFKEQCTLKLI